MVSFLWISSIAEGNESRDEADFRNFDLLSHEVGGDGIACVF